MASTTLCENILVVTSGAEVTPIDGVVELTLAIVEEAWHVATTRLKNLRGVTCL